MLVTVMDSYPMLYVLPEALIQCIKEPDPLQGSSILQKLQRCMVMYDMPIELK